MSASELNTKVDRSSSGAQTAARAFAESLAETQQFLAFEQAYESIYHDMAAQRARSAYRAKIESLRALLALNAVSELERAELDRLKDDYQSNPVVQAYAEAEAELRALCQHLAKEVSEAIGLDYAASCGASCCGQNNA